MKNETILASFLLLFNRICDNIFPIVCIKYLSTVEYGMFISMCEQNKGTIQWTNLQESIMVI